MPKYVNICPKYPKIIQQIQKMPQNPLLLSPLGGLTKKGHVLSCKKAHLLSPKKAHVLSAKKANVLSCNKAHVLSCNKAHVLASKKAHVLSCKKATKSGMKLNCKIGLKRVQDGDYGPIFGQNASYDLQTNFYTTPPPQNTQKMTPNMTHCFFGRFRRHF